MSVGVLRNSNKGLDISELILEQTEEMRQHLKQLDTASTRQAGAAGFCEFGLIIREKSPG
jgi:hypothetical protein